MRITEHGSRFRYRIACHNYYSMVIIFHSSWEPVNRNHLKMAGVCKGAISATEACFMDDTRLVGNRKNNVHCNLRGHGGFVILTVCQYVM